MEITQELLETIYQRANQFAIANYSNGEPDSLQLQSDGTIQAEWVSYGRCGDRDIDTEYISATDLTADLDEVAKQRREREAETKKKQQEYDAEQKRIREAREKEQRRQKFEELKKEFQNN